MRRPAFVALMLIALASCRDPRLNNLGSAENASSAVSIPGAVCPPAGTVAVRDNGERVTYRGPASGGVGACSVQTARGTEDLIAGIVPVEGLNVVQRSQGMARLFPLRAGNTATILFRDLDRTTNAFANFEENWTVLGDERVEAGGGARDAWIVERRERPRSSPNGAAVHRYAIDKALGLPLSYARTSSSFSAARPVIWRVTELQIPPAAPRAQP